MPMKASTDVGVCASGFDYDAPLHLWGPHDMPRRSFSRLLARTGLIALVGLAGIACAAWLVLQSSMPRYDGVAASLQLHAPAEVERDALGSATVRAQGRIDAAWALGYVHAQERYFEMDLLRRRAAGELAELFGDAAVDIDRKARAHRMRARMQVAFEALGPQQRAPIEAYRDGVNAGLAALRARPFPYLLTGNTPAPWHATDTLLVVVAMAFTLND